MYKLKLKLWQLFEIHTFPQHFTVEKTKNSQACTKYYSGKPAKFPLPHKSVKAGCVYVLRSFAWATNLHGNLYIWAEGGNVGKQRRAPPPQQLQRNLFCGWFGFGARAKFHLRRRPPLVPKSVRGADSWIISAHGASRRPPSRDWFRAQN